MVNTFFFDYKAMYTAFLQRRAFSVMYTRQRQLKVPFTEHFVGVVMKKMYRTNVLFSARRKVKEKRFYFLTVLFVSLFIY